MSFTMYVPTKTLFGAGMLGKLHEQRLPGKRALLAVSNGKSTKANGYLARVENELKLAGVEWALFDRVEADALRSTVIEGAAAAVNEGDLWDYIGSGGGKGRPLTKQAAAGRGGHDDGGHRL